MRSYRPRQWAAFHQQLPTSVAYYELKHFRIKRKKMLHSQNKNKDLVSSDG